MSLSLLQFFSAAVISYLGLLAGFFLAFLTREELPTARKYFPWLQRIVILAAAATGMSFLNIGFAVKIAAYAILLLLIAVRINIQLFYALFGALLFASAKDANSLLVLSSLVFLFGLVSGGMSFDRRAGRKGMHVRMLVSNSVYVAVAVALFLAFG